MSEKAVFEYNESAETKTCRFDVSEETVKKVCELLGLPEDVTTISLNEYGDGSWDLEAALMPE